MPRQIPGLEIRSLSELPGSIETPGVAKFRRITETDRESRHAKVLSKLQTIIVIIKLWILREITGKHQDMDSRHFSKAHGAFLVPRRHRARKYNGWISRPRVLQFCRARDLAVRRHTDRKYSVPDYRPRVQTFCRQRDARVYPIRRNHSIIHIYIFVNIYLYIKIW